MGQWYTATIKPPVDKTKRELVIHLLDFTAGRGWNNWEHDISSSPNFIWLDGNELLESDLPDLIEEIETYLDIKLEYTIKLQDQLDLDCNNSMFHSRNLLTSYFFRNYFEFQDRDVLEYYEKRFGDKQEYIEYFITNWLESSKVPTYKITELSAGHYRAEKIED